MTNLPPVNEETVIFKSDRQAAGKVCKKIYIYISDLKNYAASLLIDFSDFLICPKKNSLILVGKQSRALKFSFFS